MKKIILLFVLVLALASCSKDDDGDSITVDQTSLEMYSLDTHQITTNQSSPTYTSENEYIAKVSVNGLITARHIGETYIDINGKRKVAVTIDAKYSLYEPLHDATLTKSQVISKRGTPYSQKDTTLIYLEPNKETYAEMYTFSSSTGKLESSAIVYTTYRFLAFNYALMERYEPITYDEDKYYFYYADALKASDVRLIVVTDLYNLNYCITMYVPKVSTTRSTNESSLDYRNMLDGYRHATLTDDDR